jgi:type IV pilus assembly protein PilQ
VGGLWRDEKNTLKHRLPVLGYIPLLGDMFSYRTSTRIKSEVAVVVIPHILNIPNGDIEMSVLKRTSSLPKRDLNTGRGKHLFPRLLF